MKKNILVLLAVLFSASCGRIPVPNPTPKPPVPPQVVAWNVDVIACKSLDPCIPVSGAAIQVHYPDGYRQQTANADGYTLWQFPNGTPDSDYIINANSYKTAAGHLDVKGTHDGQKHNNVLLVANLPEPQAFAPLVIEGPDKQGLPCHSTQIVTVPDGPDPRFWRAAPWDATVPGLPFVSGGSSKHPERALSWFLDRWTTDWQDQIIAQNRRMGVTHFVLSWPDSRDGNGQSEDDFLGTVNRVNAAIPYVPTFLTSKVYDNGKSVPQHLADVTDIVNRLYAQGQRIFVVGWELDTFFSGQDLEAFSAQLIALHPDADWYWHFTTYKTSWQPDGQPRAQFWQFLAAQPHTGILGLLYQGNQNDSCGLMQAHYNDAMVPASGLQAAGALLVPFELVAMNEFDGDHPDWNDAAARAWSVTNTPGPIQSAGFSHGSRYPNGQPLLKSY